MAKNQSDVLVSDGPITLEQIIDVAEGGVPVSLSDDPEYRDRLRRSLELLHDHIFGGRPVYGATTGVGHSCGQRLKSEDVEKLGANIVRFHGCGTGTPLTVDQARAAMFCRMVSLAKGLSGVSPELLTRFADFLRLGITPVIPREGSVGASGDLTPLSYIAACMAGDRKVFFGGRVVTSAEALTETGLEPYRFGPKEPLAIMNGTSIMTGIAALVIARSRRILEAAVTATALCIHGLRGHRRHFHPGIFRAKPFPGQAAVAEGIRTLIHSPEDVPGSDAPDHLQDPYSLRCAPHVLGVLADALEWVIPWVELEANSVNDNPIMNVDSQEILLGGNFYGGHITFAMDAVKTALASLCDLCDRQIALLVDPRFSRGLPPNLARPANGEDGLHHGFKGMQITASALTAEAQKKAMPAAVFSRSTESHNQDKVSLGTIAARDADEMCLLAQRTVAIHLMAGAQSCRYRGNVASRPALCEIIERLERFSPAYQQDRPMDEDIEALAQAIGDGSWNRP